MTKRNFPGPLDDIRALLKLIPMGKEAQLRVALAWRIEADERKMQVLGETARSRIQEVSGITRGPTFDTAMGGVQKAGLFKAKRVYSRRGKRTYQRSAEYLVLRDAWPTDEVTYAERNLRPAYLTPDTHSSLTPSVSEPLTPSVSDLSISNDEVYDEVNDEGTHTPPTNLRDLNSPKLKTPTPTPPPGGVASASETHQSSEDLGNGFFANGEAFYGPGDFRIPYTMVQLQGGTIGISEDVAMRRAKTWICSLAIDYGMKGKAALPRYPGRALTQQLTYERNDSAIQTARVEKASQSFGAFGQQEAQRRTKSPFGRYTKATLGEKL